MLLCFPALICSCWSGGFPGQNMQVFLFNTRDVIFPYSPGDWRMAVVTKCLLLICMFANKAHI